MSGEHHRRLLWSESFLWDGSQNGEVNKLIKVRCLNSIKFLRQGSEEGGADLFPLVTGHV